MIDKAAYLAWKSDPMTIKFFTHMAQLRDQANDSLMNGGLTDAAIMSKYIAKINILHDLIRLGYSDLFEYDD